MSLDLPNIYLRVQILREPLNHKHAPPQDGDSAVDKLVTNIERRPRSSKYAVAYYPLGSEEGRLQIGRRLRETKINPSENIQTPNDVVLGCHKVSRAHGELSWGNGELHYQGFGSATGSKINSMRNKVTKGVHRIFLNDIIYLGASNYIIDKSLAQDPDMTKEEFMDTVQYNKLISHCIQLSFVHLLLNGKQRGSMLQHGVHASRTNTNHHSNSNNNSDISSDGSRIGSGSGSGNRKGNSSGDGNSNGNDTSNSLHSDRHREGRHRQIEGKVNNRRYENNSDDGNDYDDDEDEDWDEDEGEGGDEDEDGNTTNTTRATNTNTTHRPRKPRKPNATSNNHSACSCSIAGFTIGQPPASNIEKARTKKKKINRRRNKNDNRVHQNRNNNNGGNDNNTSNNGNGSQGSCAVM